MRELATLEKRKCIRCGNYFDWPSNNPRKTCSQICYTARNAMSMKRIIRALDCRGNGMSWYAIAKIIGHQRGNTVYMAVKRAADRHGIRADWAFCGRGKDASSIRAPEWWPEERAKWLDENELDLGAIHKEGL